MTEPGMKEIVEKLAEQQQKNIATEIIENQIKIISALYDKSVTYTNVIIIGGYAGFFGLWSLTKSYLSKEQVLWSAIFIFISIFGFVFFEVVKMIFTSYSLLRRNNSISDPSLENDPVKLLDNLKQYDKDTEKHSTIFIKYWNIMLVITVTTALIAIAILFYSFIIGLIDVYA